ncbi:YeiH family putative sulfate export transporter [Hyphomicrobium methylovorum]|uniref:YeiH family protein n=1 Tax=Hyphomicrobium methylovorum TaxID=84 RepID=UPI0015E69D53|nr:YeiH family protein [Hyphomicrobium methylovorum]MBA2125384.1 YeiH family putative sulfate export transporter [Hyphomicrobium methylovorum]
MPETTSQTRDLQNSIAAQSSRSSVAAIWPGLLLCSGIAAASFGLRELPGVAIFSPMILAIALGIALHNSIGTPSLAKAGVTFCLRRVLRVAIILLGLQLTAEQVIDVGAGGIAIIAATLVCTFLFTMWLGQKLGVERKLSELIAAGTSICGASAVIATNTVTDAPDEDVAYAVACVTVFGSIAMFVYPLMPGVLHLDAHAYGLWAGASIHEIAQVMAAAYQDGQQAGDAAAIAKLSRVAMLAPVVIVLGILATQRSRSGNQTRSPSNVPMPWFVLGFIAMVGVNSLVTVPAEAKALIVALTTFLLSMALAAMGLETDIAKLRAKGVRPLLLGFAAFLFVATFSLCLIETVG